jgi:hypothetical protein
VKLFSFGLLVTIAYFVAFVHGKWRTLHAPRHRAPERGPCIGPTTIVRFMA